MYISGVGESCNTSCEMIWTYRKQASLLPSFPGKSDCISVQSKFLPIQLTEELHQPLHWHNWEHSHHQAADLHLQLEGMGILFNLAMFKQLHTQFCGTLSPKSQVRFSYLLGLLSGQAPGNIFLSKLCTKLTGSFCSSLPLGRCKSCHHLHVYTFKQWKSQTLNA